MSRKIMMIELEPGRRMQKEAFVSASMVCPYCNGTTVRDSRYSLKK